MSNVSPRNDVIDLTTPLTPPPPLAGQLLIPINFAGDHNQVDECYLATTRNLVKSRTFSRGEMKCYQQEKTVIRWQKLFTEQLKKGRTKVVVVGPLPGMWRDHRNDIIMATALMPLTAPGQTYVGHAVTIRKEDGHLWLFDNDETVLANKVFSNAGFYTRPYWPKGSKRRVSIRAALVKKNSAAAKAWNKFKSKTYGKANQIVL